MNYRISNEYLSVEASSLGAELQSVRSASGREYLWQGDPSVWSGRSPNLFPFVGRLTDGVYELEGKRYAMKIHGLAPRAEFALVSSSQDRMELAYASDAASMEEFPREFLFTVSYWLKDRTLNVRYQVENRDSRRMYFGLGAHPGFNIPIAEGKAFEDYAVVFEEACSPKRVVFSDKVLVEGFEDYPLEDGRKLPLRHSLFDLDAVVLKDVPHRLTISAGEDGPSVEVAFPGMDYIGFWHRPKTEAPYVCVEPWVSLPGEENRPTVFEQKEDLLSLEPGERYCNVWTITVNET